MIRGLARTIIVDGKKFVSRVDLPRDAVVVNYLARPVRRKFATLVENEFNFPIWKRNNASALAEITDLDSFTLDTSILRARKNTERAILDEIREMGFRGRTSIFNSYIRGEIGRKYVKD